MWSSFTHALSNNIQQQERQLMEMVIRMLLLVFGDVFKRYIIPALLVTVVISLFSGLIASFAGGHFQIACLYSAIACGVIALIASVIVTVSVVFSRW
jgi:hypothetical protein